MRCVLGLDIGTTSTIGILIRPPDQTLALASRPVALRSDHVGWAEEDPEQWWANVGEIVRELLHASGISPADIAAVGVTGMLPAVVLLDFCRATAPPEHSAERRALQRRGRRASGRDRRNRLSRQGRQRHQSAARRRQAPMDRAARTRGLRSHRDGVRLLRLHQLAPHAVSARSSRTGRSKPGFVDLKTHAIDDALVALAHIPRAALPRKVASHEILGVVSDQGAAESGLEPGTPVIGGAADHIASALGAGVVSAGDVLLKFGGSVDILTATDHAKPDPRLFLDYHLKPGLFVPNGCMSTGGSALNWFARQFASGEAEAAKNGRRLDPSMARPRSPTRAPPAATGSSSRPIFSAKRRRSTTPARARHSTGSRSRTTSAISGGPCSRPTPMRSRIMSR